jgi:hypothetical protein
MGPWNLGMYLDLSTLSIQTAWHLDHNITNILPDELSGIELYLNTAFFACFGIV